MNSNVLYVYFIKKNLDSRIYMIERIPDSCWDEIWLCFDCTFVLLLVLHVFYASRVNTALYLSRVSVQ